MTPEQAGAVLTYVADAWPATMKLGDDTAAIWADALANIDYRDAQLAVRNLAKTDEWAPAIARVVATARGITASRHTTPALGAGRNPRAAAILAAIRAASDAVDRPAHDHHHGPENCPCCATKEQRINDYTTQTLGALREAGVIQ